MAGSDNASNYSPASSFCPISSPPLRTPEELRKIDEANYHGCLTAIFAQSKFQISDGPSVREVLDTIERRFGVTNEVLGKLTTIEVCEMLQETLVDAMQHLRPDTVDWFKQRMNYLLQCASARTRPSTG